MTSRLSTREKDAAIGAGALLLAAMLWGSTFFLNKIMVGEIPPAELTALRFGISAIALIAMRPHALHMSRTTLRHGAIMGVAFTASQVVQTYGLQYTSASVSGFLTGLYAVITALITAFILRKRPTARVWGSVGLGAAALAILTLLPGPHNSTSLGVVLTLAGSIGFAIHIVVTGRFVTRGTVFSLTIVQTIVCTVVSTAIAIPDGFVMPTRPTQWGALIYLGVFCGAVTMFLQSRGQIHLEPSRAAVIMSSEPVWSAVFAIIAGQEPLAARTVLGGAIMMAAIWLAAAPSAKRLSSFFRLSRWRSIAAGPGPVRHIGSQVDDPGA